MIRVRQLVPLLCLVCLSAGSAFAESATATLSGVALDEQGNILPAVTVTLVNSATGQQGQAKTNAEGNFTFPQLPPCVVATPVNVVAQGQFSANGQRPSTCWFKAASQLLCTTKRPFCFPTS